MARTIRVLVLASAMVVAASAASVAQAASATTISTPEQAYRYMVSAFPYIAHERHAPKLPMGAQMAPLERDRVYLRTLDPATGQVMPAFASGLFGYGAADGSVLPIDTALELVGGRWSPRGVDFTARLPRRFHQGVVWGAGQGTIRLVPIGARRAVGAVVGDGDRVAYANAWPATDALLIARGAELKDHLIIRDLKAAPKRFAFRVHRERSARTVIRYGAVRVVRRSGEEVALLPAPVGRDADGVHVRMWYTVKRGKRSDLLTLRYSTAPDLREGTPAAQAPLDLDPSFEYTADWRQGDAVPDVRPAPFAQATSVGNESFRVAFTPGTTYDAGGSYARWNFRPHPGTSWNRFTGRVQGHVGSNQEVKLFNSGSSGGAAFFEHDPGKVEEFDRNASGSPTTFLVFRMLQVRKDGDVPSERWARLSNLVRTFNDLEDPDFTGFSRGDQQPAPRQFSYSVSFSDGESGCAGGTIQLLEYLPPREQLAVRKFNGCAATVSFDADALDLDDGEHLLRTRVCDKTGRCRVDIRTVIFVGEGMAWLTLPEAGEDGEPGVGDRVHDVLRVEGAVDHRFMQRIELSLDGYGVIGNLPAPTVEVDEEYPFAGQVAVGHVPAGTYQLRAIAYDVFGRPSVEQETVEIRIDHSAPDVAFSSPADAAHFNESVPVVLQAADPQTGIRAAQVRLDGVPIAVHDEFVELADDTPGFDETPEGGPGGDFAIELEVDCAAEGTHTLTGSATNWAGIGAEPQPRMFVTDCTQPSAAILAPAAGASVTGDTAFTVNAADANFARGELLLTDSEGRQFSLASLPSAGTHTFVIDTHRIQSGEYDLTLIVVDRAGNELELEQALIIANPVYSLGQEAWLSSTEHDSGLTVGHATGNLTTTATDVSTNGLGLPLVAERSYNHQGAGSGSFGTGGWHASFDRRIDVGLDHVATYTDADGTRHVMYPRDGGGFERAQGLTADLSRSGDGFELRHLDGLRELFDPAGRLLGDVDRNGNRRSVVRDAGGAVVAVQDGSGLRLAIARDTAGRVASVQDQLGRTTRYAYDPAGRLTRVTDPAGGATQYGYDDAGRLAQVTDPVGRVTKVAYAGTRVQELVDNAGVRTAFVYGAEVSVTVAQRQTYRYELDEAGRAVAITDPEQEQMTQQFDEQGLLVEVVDESGDATVTEYDAFGRKVAETDAEDNTTRWGDFDAYGNAGAVTDPVGGVTRYSFDASGNTVSVRTPEGGVTQTLYDAAGNTVSATDPNGNTTEYERDAHGSLIKTVQPGGVTTVHAVDAAGQVLSTTDPVGATTRYSYDAAGRQTATIDALGNVTVTAFDAAGDVTAETDARGNTTSFGFDAVGREVLERDALGGETATVYDALGNETSTVDANGHATSYEYNVRGDLVAEVDPLGSRTTYQLDAQGRVVAEIDPAGNVTRTVYDGNGNVLQTVHPDGSVTAATYTPDSLEQTSADGEANVSARQYDGDRRQVALVDPEGATTRSGYDLAGNTVASVDAAGHETLTRYDALGRAVEVTNPDGSRRATGYDAAGRAVSLTDENGHSAATAYDALGRVTASTDAAGAVTRYAWDANGNMVAETDPNGHVTTHAYDELDRRVSSTDAEGNVTRFAYDAVGNLVRETDPAGSVTVHEYDAADQLVRTTDPNGLVTTFGYDSRGNQTTVTDPLGRTTTTAYDSMSRVSSVTDPQGGTTSYVYDRAGRVVSRTDQSGVVTSFVYDRAGRVVSESSAVAGTTTRTWDARGLMLTETTPAGTTSFAYDSRGRTTQIDYPDGTQVAFVYDAAGNVVSRSDSSGTTVYEYDAVNRPVAETQPGGVRFEYVYDAAGNVVSMRVDGDVSSLSYDKRNLLTRLQTDAGSTSFTYTPQSQLASVIGVDGRTTTYSYDQAMRLTRIVAGDGTEIRYAFDGASRITSANYAGRSHTYTYDERGQLTSWTLDGITTLYAYDARGNLVSERRQVASVEPDTVPPGIEEHIDTCLETHLADCPNPEVKETIEQLTATHPEVDPATLTGVRQHVAEYFANQAVSSRSFTYNDTNQLVELTDHRTGQRDTFEYDRRGNQTRAGERSLSYDSRSRLASVSWPGTTIAYAYDDRGLITTRTKNGSQTSRYWYDAQQRLRLERRVDGTKVRYHHGAQGLEAFSVGSATYRLNVNHRGDIMNVTTTRGDIAARYSYTPWGETSGAGDAAAVDANIHAYNGRDEVRLDPDTGMYWMRARWYAPGHGRFLSVDPLPTLDGTVATVYGYVAGDPVNATDASGKRAAVRVPRLVFCHNRVKRPQPLGRGTRFIKVQLITRCSGSLTPGENGGLRRTLCLHAVKDGRDSFAAPCTADTMNSLGRQVLQINTNQAFGQGFHYHFRRCGHRWPRVHYYSAAIVGGPEWSPTSISLKSRGHRFRWPGCVQAALNDTAVP